MTNKEFYRELGNIDPKMIEAAAPAEKVQKKKKNVWVKWVSIAACFSASSFAFLSASISSSLILAFIASSLACVALIILTIINIIAAIRIKLTIASRTIPQSINIHSGFTVLITSPVSSTASRKYGLLFKIEINNTDLPSVAKDTR